MTAIAESLQADVEGVSASRAVVVGIMAGDGVQIGVLLDANAPVSVMTDPLLKVVNSRLRELGEAPLEGGAHLRIVLDDEERARGRVRRHGAPLAAGPIQAPRTARRA